MGNFDAGTCDLAAVVYLLEQPLVQRCEHQPVALYRTFARLQQRGQRGQFRA
jgi:hypothetical protein